jgi:hypothetical protein
MNYATAKLVLNCLVTIKNTSLHFTSLHFSLVSFSAEEAFGLLMWGAISDEKSGLYFSVFAGHRQRSLSQL